MNKTTGNRINSNANENICIEWLVRSWVCLISRAFYIIYKYIENIISYSSHLFLGYSPP